MIKTTYLSIIFILETPYADKHIKETNDAPFYNQSQSRHCLAIDINFNKKIFIKAVNIIIKVCKISLTSLSAVEVEYFFFSSDVGL